MTRTQKLEVRELCHGLGFPEGPIAMPDGSVLVVEIRAGTLTRVLPDGSKTVVANTGGGPNGAAIGADGAVYICNNGGLQWTDMGGIVLPGMQANDNSGGSIQRVDLASGDVTSLYTECNGHPLKGPNDIVVDSEGGLWFTDHGHVRERDRDRGGVYYATADGASISEALYPLDGPNGIGLSPDGARLYVAETFTGKVFCWDLDGPGKIRRNPQTMNGGRLVGRVGDMKLIDSLAVDADDNVCVATIGPGGVEVMASDGSAQHHVLLPDPVTTNICFGGPKLSTAFITLSGTGRLVACDWPTAGTPLSY